MTDSRRSAAPLGFFSPFSHFCTVETLVLGGRKHGLFCVVWMPAMACWLFSAQVRLFFRLIGAAGLAQYGGILGHLGFLRLRRLVHDSSDLCASGRYPFT